MRLLPGDIVLIHRGTGWMIFAPLVWLWQWAVGPYHVELAWNPSTDNIFTSLSMQPPVLDVVEIPAGCCRGISTVMLLEFPAPIALTQGLSRSSAGEVRSSQG